MAVEKSVLGSRLAEARRAMGLTQLSCARMLDVTDKAVSKWETGAAFPSTDSLMKLSEILGVPMADLLAEEPVHARVAHIVLTGGPCAGKTTAMSWLANDLAKKGWRVLFVPETATELIGGGVTPRSCPTPDAFQRHLFELQLAKEKVFLEAARSMDVEKVLVVCDRGLLDNKAYMTDRSFARTLHDLGLGEAQARDRYDAVFHLVTAAKGARGFYTLANNGARTETPEAAAALDDRLIAAWTGHPHLRVIGNDSDFEHKMLRLLKEVTSFLGEPEPFEVERKFLVRKPEEGTLDRLPGCRRVEILQTYLRSPDDSEVRVRQFGADGDYTYVKTTKKPYPDPAAGTAGAAGAALARIELEERLTREQYLRLLMDADPACQPIRKTRWCYMHGQHYLEIDLFPFWDDRAIVEVELSDGTEKVELPEFLHVLREVTDDPAYTNHALAMGGRGR